MAHFPRERDELLGWLAKAGIRGVIFLSGDWHMTKLIHHNRAGGYPLYELTCSPPDLRATRSEFLHAELQWSAREPQGHTARLLLWEHRVAEDALR